MKIIGSLSKDDGDGNENGKKAIDLVSKTTALLVQHAFFFTFLCRPCTTHDVKLSNLTFYGGREHKTTTLFFFS